MKTQYLLTLFAIVSAVNFSACQDAPEAPASDIQQAVSDSLLDGQYLPSVFSFKSFTTKTSKKDTVGGKKVTLYTGTAVVTTRKPGIIAATAYKGDGTHHRWSKYIRNFKSQAELDALIDQDAKAKWTNGGHVVLAGTDVEVEDITIGCWFGQTAEDPKDAFRCYRPQE